MTTAADVADSGPVLAVLTVEDAAHAAPLAAALIAGGVRALEVTLRTAAALDAIAAMRRIEGALVGAGTVLSAADAQRAIGAGAHFLVSPGFHESIAGAHGAVPWLPGVATASEIMRALTHGYTLLKFFPAETSGGAAAVAAFAGPFGSVRFCPTGGISASRAGDYLSLANVACVGGSWLAPKELIARQDWAEITARAKAAASLRR